MEEKALFMVGQLVRHKLFGYRGVVVDVDPEFMLSEDWYDTVAKTRPPRHKPWYHILVHNSLHKTYVAERNILPDQGAGPVNHPDLYRYFGEFSEGRYIPSRKDH